MNKSLKHRNYFFLLFHSVNITTEKTNALYPPTSISVSDFESIIKLVSEKYRANSLEEFVDSKVGQQKCPTFLVTFDDGFLDNYEIALPILEKYQVPAIIYITSGFVDRSVYPFEYQLADIIQKVNSLKIKMGKGSHSFLVTDERKSMECFKSLKDWLKPQINSERQRVIGELDFDNQMIGEVIFLSKEKILEIGASSLITLGSHTHYHQLLTSLSLKESVQDIEKGKKYLELWSGLEIKHFSYPYGSFNSQLKLILADMGFVSAVTTKESSIHRVDLFELPRFEMHSLEDFHRLKAKFSI